MSKEEMICKNCKYHYIEEISFDYPQSCCDKRKAVIEEWFNCNDFEYSDKYIEQLQQENKHLKMIIKEYERLENGEPRRGFKITRVDEYNIDDLIKYKDNWNKLKGYLHNQIPTDKTVLTKYIKIFEVLNKMQKLEKGSDSNE